GISLQGLLLAAGLNLGGSSTSPPGSFRMNLLIQAKRCMVYPLPEAPMKLTADLKKGPWHCFRREKKQQGVLERLHAKLSGGGAGPVADVSYAAPCFSSRSALWESTKTGKLTVKSTFPEATRLSGHVRWAYNEPGANGTSLSEPEKATGPSLVERLETLYQAFRRPADQPRSTSADSDLRALDAAVVQSLVEENISVIHFGDTPLANETLRSHHYAARIAANCSSNDARSQ